MADTLPLVALVGCPNTGKSALFNRLTGSRQKVANYPGVTVERREGLTHDAQGAPLRVLDLPGLYSLRASSPDERVTRDVLLGRHSAQPRPDLVVLVADASNLALHLRLLLEIKALGLPVVVALNMVDIAARRGIEVDAARLSAVFGVPFVATVAVRNGAVAALRAHLTGLAQTAAKSPATHWHEPSPAELRQLARAADSLLLQAGVRGSGVPAASTRLDALLLHPLAGSVLLLGLMFIMFQLIFTVAQWPSAQIQAALSALSDGLAEILPPGFVLDFLSSGVLAGVGSVLVFLPQILLLYACILTLEDSGYMARAAFLLDRVMGGVGLHGRAFIPLLSSFACAVPGIMATRTIAQRSDRLSTILIAPLMTCSARIPVYTLLIAAFIPPRLIHGMNLQGLVMFGLYLVGLVSGLLVALVLKRLVFRERAEPLLMELPHYHWPSAANLLLGLLERTKIFLSRAGRVILLASIVIWALARFPGPPPNASEPAIVYSFAGQIGYFLAPLFAPLGFTWQTVVALIPGMAAREVVVAALATVYAVGGDAKTALMPVLAQAWSLPAALAFLAWYVYAPQCISTLAVIRRETNSVRWMWFAFTYLFALAYGAAWLTYQAACAWL